MAPKNLWGELPTADETGRSPKSILEEQASVLSQHSANRLLGRVTTATNPYGQLEHELLIVAPFLNNYEVAIVRAAHTAETYPVSAWDIVDAGLGRRECQSDEDFEHFLGTVLTSKKVRIIISSLLSQTPRKPPPPTGMVGSLLVEKKSYTKE
mgnify:CR=1 FL=1